MSIVNELSPLQWRSLNSVPTSVAEYDFSHRQAARQYYDVDGDAHEHTGRNSIPFTATLHFLNTIRPTLYPNEWNDWREALFDGGSGLLRHPDLGEIDARVVSGKVRISPQSTHGIEVQVSWTETNNDIDEEANFDATSVSVEEAAEAVDAAMTALGIEYPDGQPEPSLTESIKAVQGQIFTASQSVVGKLNSVKGTLDSIVFQHQLTMNAVSNADQAAKDAIAGAPAVWAFRAVTATFRNSIDNAINIAQQKGRPTGSTVTAQPTSLSKLSSELGQNLDDLIALNPFLATNPTVSLGSRVLFFTDV